MSGRASFDSISRVSQFSEVAASGAHHAVSVLGLYKSYGDTPILQGINMTVPIGCIYGLLGPSGCGKSTFLKILTGRLSYKQGTVSVFGQRPGTEGHGVPGPLVGYMPQEIALFGDLNIKQTLTFYAKLYCISDEAFEKRIEWLKTFLHLPPLDRTVSQLSGGQQRRVSLAVALVHSPKLLILDEPTVGVDPVLRARIWEHLVEISKLGISVIITTHYIEEAAMANRVGMMRDGVLLAEGRPKSLMRKFHASTLETVFLNLCHSSTSADKDFGVTSLSRNTSISSETEPSSLSSIRSILHTEDVSTIEGSPDVPFCGGMPIKSSMWAIIWKNFIILTRNRLFLISQFLLPAIQIMLFCLAIGNNPKNLSLAVVNLDSGFSNIAINGSFSSYFLNSLDSSMVKKVFYDDYETALASVKSGNTWGIVSFKKDYSAALLQRCTLGNVSTQILLDSNLNINLDSTNQQIATSLTSAIVTALLVGTATQLSLVELAGLHVSFAPVTPAIQLQTPVYGSENAKFSDFIAPGMIIGIAFAQSIGLTAISFVLAKKEGTLDRQWAAGVKPSEIMVTHVITQFMILAIQISLLLLVALVMFGITCKGNVFLLVFLSLLLGMSGMLYGLFLSSICDDEQQAIQFSSGSFFPVLLLSGILWPVEGIPHGLRYVSYLLPTTWAATAMRDILSRGWGVGENEVWMGFVVVIGWSVVLLAASSRGVRHVD